MFMKTHKKKIIYLTAGLCSVFVILFCLTYVFLPVRSQSAGRDFYGGPITNVTYCTCPYDFGVMLTIEDKSQNGQILKIFYDPYTSLLRAYYNIWKPGPQVLGAYIPSPQACEMISIHGCYIYDMTSGTIDSIKGIGTTAN
jgi:hypothetical protein